MSSPAFWIILCIASWGVVALFVAAALITMIIRRLILVITAPWRHAPATIEPGRGETLTDEPAPYRLDDSAIDALAAMVMCPLCCPHGRHGDHGLCICPEDCGHPACVFAHVELTWPSEAEERFMNGKGAMP